MKKNTCRRVLYDSNVHKLVSEEVPERYRAVFEVLGQRLVVILRTMSCKIKIKDYHQYCTDTNILLLTQFLQPNIQGDDRGLWLSITPSVHKLLAHYSWELIHNNDSFGLGNLDEAGMEGCNKILRSVRKSLSRKTLHFFSVMTS